MKRIALLAAVFTIAACDGAAKEKAMQDSIAAADAKMAADKMAADKMAADKMAADKMAADKAAMSKKAMTKTKAGTKAKSKM